MNTSATLEGSVRFVPQSNLNLGVQFPGAPKYNFSTGFDYSHDSAFFTRADATSCRSTARCPTTSRPSSRRIGGRSGVAGRIARLSCLLAMLAAAPSHAASAGAPASTAASSVEAAFADPPPALDEVVSFLDGAVSAQLRESVAPGAAVAFVDARGARYVRGYGLADRASGAAVDGERTLFRIASVSKVFVAAGVARLAQQNRLDLDAPANRYLRGVRLPGPLGDAVTVRHLLTHTAGLEEADRATRVRSTAELRSLAEAVGSRSLQPVRPPGTLAVYTNLAFATAALAIEEAGGAPYERWLETELLEPLGMDGTSARQPLPDPLRRRLATGYEGPANALVATDFELLDPAPNGSVTTSAADMARFMLAAMAGTENDPSVPWQPQFRARAGVGAMGLGWWLEGCGADLVATHGGSLRGYRAYAMLLPRRGVGLFVAYNAGHVDETHVAREFLDRFFPNRCIEPAPASVVDAPAAERGPLATLRAAAAEPGFYGGLRFSRSSPMHLRILRDSGHVQRRDDGRLVYLGSTWEPEGGALFGKRVESGGLAATERLAFARLGATAPILLRSTQPPNPRVRLPITDTLRFHLALLAAAFLCWLVALLLVAVRAVRSARTSGRQAWSDASMLAILAAVVAAAALVVCVAGVADYYYHGPSLAYRTASWAGAGSALLMAGAVWRAWARLETSLSAVLAGIAFAVLFWELQYWNLLPRLRG